MYHLDVGKGGIVTDFRFVRPVQPAGGADPFAVDHDRRAAELARGDARFASVLILAAPLRSDLYDDPRYMHKTNHILVSEVEGEARKRMINRYMSDRDAVRLLRKQRIPLWEDNVVPDDGSFKRKLIDAVWKAEEESLFPEIVEEFWEEARFEYDESTDEERELAPAAFRKKWAKRRLEIFLPRVETEHRRAYSMPEPFGYWDPRNPFQQWFFIDDGESISYAQGGPGGSGQREAMGRYAHLFVTLARRHRREAPTDVLQYTETNQLRRLRHYDRFMVLNRDLTGNYQADHAQVARLFKGRLLDWDPNKNITVEWKRGRRVRRRAW